MPLYDIRCEKSEIVFERFIKLSDFEVPITCACGAPGKRLISKPMISVEAVGYNCPVTGKWVGSKKAHQENLREQGCRVLEPGEKEFEASGAPMPKPSLRSRLILLLRKKLRLIHLRRKRDYTTNLSMGD
jgi:predicted nucleic acid-binding Zn ribbon protein